MWHLLVVTFVCLFQTIHEQKGWLQQTFGLHSLIHLWLCPCLVWITDKILMSKSNKYFKHAAGKKYRSILFVKLWKQWLVLWKEKGFCKNSLFVRNMLIRELRLRKTTYCWKNKICTKTHTKVFCGCLGLL